MSASIWPPEEAVQHATDCYRKALAGYYEVLEAQQQLYPAQTTLAQLRRGRLVTHVRLYKALGGGVEPDRRSVERRGSLSMAPTPDLVAEIIGHKRHSNGVATTNQH